MDETNVSKILTVRDLKACLSRAEDSLPIYLDQLNEEENAMVDVVIQSDEEGEFVVLTTDPRYVASLNREIS